MTARKHSDLRSLALAYYWGWIPRDKYVDMRKVFLEAISEGKQPKPIKPQDLAPPKKKSPTDPKNNSGIILTAGIVFVVIIAIFIAVYFILPDSDESMQPDKAQPAGQNTVSGNPSLQIAASTPESLFSDFLNDTFIQNQDWKADSLNVLKYKWQGLSQEQQLKLREDRNFREFSEILIGKIAQERSLNNVVPSDKELTLMTAARNMALLDQLPAE